MKKSQVSIRIPDDITERIDSLVPRIQADSTTAAIGAVTRAAVIRLALAHGVDALEGAYPAKIYKVFDADTSAPLDGEPSDELVEMSTRTEAGIVLGYLDGRTWKFIAESDVSSRIAGGVLKKEQVRHIFVDER